MTIKQAIKELRKRGEITFRGIDEHRYEVYVGNECLGVWDSEREEFVDERRNETCQQDVKPF
jgi:hypothetical protein